MYHHTISHRQFAGDQVTESKIANFTFIFGCEEGSGIRVDTNQANNLITFLSANFSPTTGQLRIPHVFDQVEKCKVGFETLTSSLG
jgi:hypothetical protein